MTNPNELPRISMIVAQARNRAIGKDNNLLWHLGSDLKRFKQLTMGHPIIMGRRTWESLPKKPLPGRRNIVMTTNPEYKPEGAEVIHGIGNLKKVLAGEEEAFVIGGAAIYEALMPYARRLYVTWVNREYDADVFFPVIDLSTFTLVNESAPAIDEASGLEYTYAEYDRKPWPSL